VQVILRNAAHDVYGESPALLSTMTRFLKGDRVRDTTITFPIEFHGPDEPKLTAELHALVLAKGPAAALARAREMRAPGSGQDLTSYVLVNVATTLDRTDKRPADAIEILRGATAMFPDMAVLYSRLGGALLAAGDRTGAATAYRAALKMNPFFRFSAVQLAKLEAAP
jgi:predicted Zn-dependent protease